MDTQQTFEKIESLLKERSDTIGIIKAFLYHAPAPAIMLDLNLRLVLWSRKFAIEFMDKNSSEFQGMPLEMVAPKVFDAFKGKDLLNLSLDGKSFEGFIGINGHRRYYAFEVAPWFDGGQISGIVASFINVTEMKNKEMALKESEQKFKDLLSLSTDWVWETNPQGEFTYSSDGVKSILEYDPEEVIGKTAFHFFANQSKGAEQQFFQAVRDKRPLVNLVNWNITKSGNEICLLTNAVPMFNEQNQILGFRGVDRKIPCINNVYCESALKGML
jgi:PAS domain S-box-containing protein